MKLKELLEAWAQFDPELPVAKFDPIYGDYLPVENFEVRPASVTDATMLQIKPSESCLVIY